MTTPITTVSGKGAPLNISEFDTNLVNLRNAVDQALANTVPAAILAALLTVDGAGSGLDADKVDGIEVQDIMANQGTITGAVDLNDYTTTGYWEQPSDVDAGNGTNYPVAKGGQLIVVAATVDLITQVYYANDGSSGWRRTYASSVWSSWSNLTGPQGPAGQGVPSGGAAGELLAKIDGTDYNTEWIDPATVGVTDHGALTGLGDDDHPHYFLNIRPASQDWDLMYSDIRELLVFSGSTNPPVGASTNFGGMYIPITTGYGWQIAAREAGSNEYLYFRTREASVWGTWRKIWHEANDGSGSGLDADLLDGNEATAFAVAAKGVTNGDSHDHIGGDGAQIDHGGLAGLGDDDHTRYYDNNRLNLNEGSTGQDPNTASVAVILTNHANTPNSGYYWHIITTFYSSVSGSGNRAQLAMQYSGSTHEVYSRHCYSSVWSAWARVWTNQNDGPGSGLRADTLDNLHASSFPQFGSYFTAMGDAPTYGSCAITGTRGGYSGITFATHNWQVMGTASLWGFYYLGGGYWPFYVTGGDAYVYQASAMRKVLTEYNHGSGANGYSMQGGSYTYHNFVDSTNYYFGGYYTADTLADRTLVIIPKAGTIKAARFVINSTGAAGSAETIYVYYRINGGDALLGSVATAAARKIIANDSLSVAVNAGDTIQMRMLCPAWATNPTTSWVNWSIYIET